MTRPPATPAIRPRKGQYAFWHYDKFPYFLGGVIERTVSNPHGGATRNDPPFLVAVTGYGGYFPARVVLPPGLGEKVLELQKRLRQERADFDEAIDHYWRFTLSRALEGVPGIMERIVQP